MKDHTTTEIFEELWKRIEYDANVSEELASESNELQARIYKAIDYIEKFIPIDNDTILMRERQRDYLLDILKGGKENE